MEQRRFILFISLSMLVLIGWMNAGPMLFPGMFPKPRPRRANQNQQQADGKQKADKQDADGKKQPDPADGLIAEKKDPQQPDDVQAKVDDEPDAVEKPAKPVKADELPKFPRQTISLGSLDPETGYFLKVKLVSPGAAVQQIELTDPRYKDLKKLGKDGKRVPLKVVGHTGSDLHTLQTSVDVIDEQLKQFNTDVSQLDWEVIEKVRDKRFNGQPVYSGVTFRMISPDGRLEVRKRFTLKHVDKQGSQLTDARDSDASGYQLHFDLTIRNLGDQKQVVVYKLQGPVGVPFENAANARTYRAIKKEFYKDGSASVPDPTTAAKVVEIAEEVKQGKRHEWREPIKFIGVDVQFFAALLVPVENQLQLKTPYISISEPVLIEENKEKPSHSDISFRLTSNEIHLGAGREVTHSYRFYAGPKRQILLEDKNLDATSILELGWFGFVAKVMLKLLTFLHGLGIPYGFAIIFMTVMVRGCLFPLSRKQAIGAKKMKELQPQLQELRKKYGKDKEKMARAQMELFSKNNYNPFAGCLPIFLQLPIFIGLYTALNNAVDLRLAPFPLTWIKNLAAPDALFPLGFTIPFIGSSHFNLLPLITVGLFVAQQKMFMPPPTDDQQAMQYKMMNFMMIFMGFMFYKVPSGLCVYFIASSLWGMGERKMLDFGQPKKPDAVEGDVSPRKKAREERRALSTGKGSSNGASAKTQRSKKKSPKRSRPRR